MILLNFQEILTLNHQPIYVFMDDDLVYQERLLLFLVVVTIINKVPRQQPFECENYESSRKFVPVAAPVTTKTKGLNWIY